jgi:biotin-dependent carboxylase-like uncharacterized protein
MIEVLQPGLLSSLQDTGRVGYGHLGIGRAGGADLPALALANALVGNDAHACAIESTLVGPRLRLHRSAWVALTGAPMPRARVDGHDLPMWRPVRCAAGSVLDLGPMSRGCRSYLAIAGGLSVDSWLGSRSSDLNAGLGPVQGRALAAGDTLDLGAPVREPVYAGHWSLDPEPWFPSGGDPPEFHLMPASHTDAMDRASRDMLSGGAVFRVDSESNRVGVRMQADRPLQLRQSLEMVSEGLVPGTMQLPPGGQPILMLAEHPVTGGYPRIAHLASVDLPRLAQLRPGDTLRFRWVDADRASEARRIRDRELEQLQCNIRTRLEQGT